MGMTDAMHKGSPTTCNQCGRKITDGMTYYWDNSWKSIAGSGYKKSFCSEGCYNTYYGSKNAAKGGSSSGRASSGGKSKQVIVHKNGMSTKSKDLIVKSVIGLIAFAFIGGILMSIQQCASANIAASKAKKIQAAEYVIDKGSATLAGEFSKYFEVAEDVKVEQKAGVYESVVNLTLKCKTPLNTVDFISEPAFYIESKYAVETTPSAWDWGAAIYGMEKGAVKTFKVKVEPRVSLGSTTKPDKETIKRYQDVISAAELGNITFRFYYVTKGKKEYSKEF
ncbi:MAG: hypothetical protein MJZ50_10180 [Treponema sp.]|nr:hypothetical protein [Treponema sp.]